MLFCWAGYSYWFKCRAKNARFLLVDFSPKMLFKSRLLRVSLTVFTMPQSRVDCVIQSVVITLTLLWAAFCVFYLYHTLVNCEPTNNPSYLSPFIKPKSVQPTFTINSDIIGVNVTLKPSQIFASSVKEEIKNTLSKFCAVGDQIDYFDGRESEIVDIYSFDDKIWPNMVMSCAMKMRKLNNHIHYNKTG